ncbi:MAG TPA: DUF4331 family protein, partial [Kofleriaceae bacterium]|nr:DUF4331 family protein [Kofleriaceae bacterium]
MVAVLASSGQAADHADSPTLATNQMADITDVYAWVNGSNLNLIMDVSPGDDGTHGFSPAVLYVFHLTSKSGPAVNAPGGPETRVICRFDASTSVECWVVSDTTTKDYVSGDPSNTAGVTSLLGRVKVFAGRRSDPLFFSATGFRTAVTTFLGQATGAPDGAGCPKLMTPGQAGALRTAWTTGSDDFATSNVMALVVQLDKSLVN